MALGDIFTKSFEDYKKNFKLVFKGALLLDLIPYIVFMLILFLIVLFSASSIVAEFTALSESFGDVEPSFSDIWNVIQQAFVILMPILIIAFLLGIVVWFLSFMFTIVIYYLGFNNGKLTLSEAFRNSLSFFWRFFGYSLLLFLIFLLFLFAASLPILLTVLLWNSIPLYAGVLLILFCVIVFILALILGVYLAISWIFTMYIIINEKRGILDSMRRSREIIRGRWWLTFGYSLLLGLIAGTISYMVNSFGSLLQIPLQFLTLGGDVFMIVVYYFGRDIISHIFGFLLLFTVTSYSIFFIKNIYLEFIGKNKPEAEKIVNKNVAGGKKTVKKK